MTIDVEDLLNAPEGTVRRGDEFHTPANWWDCERCGKSLPVDVEACGCDERGRR